MRFALPIAALFAAVASALPTGTLEARQQHPAGPGRQALINLLGKSLYHEISADLHAVGIAVAHTEQRLNQIVTSIDPTLGDDLHSLLSVVDTLEADLVSIGFNT